MDMIHNVAKLVDHNRWLTLSGAMVMALMGTVAGCRVTTVDPATGQRVDEVGIAQARLEADAQRRLLELAVEHAKLTGDADAVRTAEGALAAGSVMHAERLAQLEILAREIAETRRRAMGLVRVAGAVAEGGVFSTGGLVNLGVTAAAILLGAGAALDNRRKDRVIRTLKTTAPDTGG